MSGTSVRIERADGGRNSRRDRWLGFFERYTLVILFVATLVFFSVWSKTAATFLTVDNFRNVLGNQSVIGILSLAIMIPLVSARFDFAVGPVAGLSQVLTAGFMARLGAPLGVAVLVGLAVGAVVGVVSGTTVAKLGVNSLIVTLGVSAMLSGVVLWYTESQSIISGISQDLVNFGSGTWFGIPRTVYVLIVVAVLVHYLLEQTPYGRYLHSIGSNEPAARLVGIPVERFVLLAFVLSGTLAAFAGVLLVARNGSSEPASRHGERQPAGIVRGVPRGDSHPPRALQRARHAGRDLLPRVHDHRALARGCRQLDQRRLQRRRAVRRGDRVVGARAPSGAGCLIRRRR